MDFWQPLLRLLANAMGMATGPDTEVSFTFSLFPGGGGGLLVSLALILLFFLGYLSLRHLATNSPGWLRFTCGTLRGMALVLPALIILGPGLVTSKVDKLEGTTLVMVDSSWSMRRADPGEKLTRIGQVNDFLAQDNNGFLTALAQRNRVHAFSFASAVKLLERKPGVWEEINATGPATNLAVALNRILEEENEGRIAAAILFTDGRWNEGGEPAEIAADLGRRSIPLYVIGVGDPTPRPIVRLEEIDAPERAFSRDPFSVKVKLDIPPTAREVLVSLHDQINGGKPKKLETRRLPVPANGKLETVFRIKPGLAGTHCFKAKAWADGCAEGEKASGQVVVEIASQPARVLLVAGSPTYEYRTLVRLFIRDKTVDLTCWLQSANSQYPQSGNTTCRKLPLTKEELRPYHAVILVDPDPLHLDLSFATNLAHLVREEGTGLAYIAGEKFSLTFFDKQIRKEVSGPLVNLLPAVPDQEIAKIHIGMGRFLTQPWPLMVTATGRRDRLLALDGRPERIAMLFGSLPGMYWNYPFKQPGPGAHILATHRGQDTLHQMQNAPRPLILWQYTGAGRVYLSAVDETWRWRGVAEKTFNRYWVRLARFLAESKLTADRMVHRLVTDRRSFEVGTEITITDKLPRQAEIESLEVVIQGPDGNKEKLLLSQPLEKNQTLQGIFTPTKPGLYQVATPNLKGALPARFEVREPALEQKGPQAMAALKAIATSARGSYLPFAKAADLPTMIPEATEILVTESNPKPLWDNLVFLLLAVLLLATELFLRKVINLP